MDPSTLRIDASNHRLRRVGRLVRRRLRIEGSNLTNGIHTDGRLSVVISGLGRSDAGVPGSFRWWASRPVALVITRSGGEADEVSFTAGPLSWGTAVLRPGEGHGEGVGYIAFAYDTDRETVGRPASARRAPAPSVARILARMLGSAAPA